MTTLQTTEIFDRVRESRAKFIERILTFQLNHSRGDTAIGYIIDYLRAHEQANHAAMDDLRQQPHATMKHFVRFFPTHLDMQVHALLIDDQHWCSEESLIGHALEVKGCYRDLFASCANGQGLSSTQSYFTKLHDMEEMQLQDIGRRLSELEQGY